jgi:hypothetical protein
MKYFVDLHCVARDRQPISMRSAQITLSIGSLNGSAGQAFLVPVTINNVPQQGISSFNLQLSYDNNLFYIEGIDRSGSLSSSILLKVDAFDGGQKRLRVIKDSGSTISQNGVLFYLVGRRLRAGSNPNGITISSFNVNNGNVTISLSAVPVTITSGTSLQLSIPNQTSTLGSTIDIPIRLSPITRDYGAYSYLLTFGYNPNVFDFVNLVTSGTLSGSSSNNSCFSLPNPTSPGRILVNVACISPINGTLDLLRIRMRVKPDAPRNSTLQIVSFVFDNNTPPVETSNGTMLVTNGTAVSLDEAKPLVTTYILHSAYPNPFNPSTVIPIELPQSSFVTLSVVDSSGKEIRKLVQGFMTSGRHEIQWNAGDLPSGVYMIRLAAGGEVHTSKATLIK